MIASYSEHRPGTTLKQNLVRAASAGTPPLMSCMVGPRFILNRYGKESVPATAFNAAGQTLAFEHKVQGITELLDLEAHTVDLDSLRLYGVGLEAGLATFTAAGSPSFTVPDLSDPHIIKIDAGHVKGGSLASAFRGRPVKAGDLVYCTGIENGTVYRRKVVSLMGVVANGTFGANSSGTDTLAGNSNSNPVDSTAEAAQVSAPANWTIGCAAPENFNGLARGAKYITQYGEQFIITVHTPGTAGVRQVETATVAGTIGASGAGNAEVVVTSASLTGSPITLSVAVANNDTASQVATKIRAALNANATITAKFTVGGSGATVSLTKIVAEANDSTLNISIDNDTCSGLTTAATSANTTAGSASVGTVNIASASGLFQAANVATSTLNGQGTFTITDAAANGELGGVSLLITPPAAEPLAAGQTFVIRVIGDYSRLSTTQVTVSGTYTGSKNTTYMVRVTQSVSGSDFTGAEVEISDTAGVDDTSSGVEVTEDTSFDLGSLGLSMKFTGSGDMPAHGGLRVGDIFFVHAKAGATSTTNFDTVVLDGPAVDTLVFTNSATQLFSVAFRKEFTGEILQDADNSGTAWTPSADNVVTEAALSMYLADRTDGYRWCDFVNGVGQLALSYRAFVNVDDTNTLLLISAASELEDSAGVVDLDNDLGFAAQQALIGSEGKTIGVLNTGGATAEHYAAALALIENTKEPYELCILGDTSVWDTALTHVATCSSEDNRKFRRMRVAVDSPGAYAVMSKRADSTNFTATISPYSGGNKLLTIVDGSDEVDLRDLELNGDGIVKLIDAGTEYKISSVISATEAVLTTGPDSAVDPAVTVEIWLADTVASQKAWLIARAKSLADRRASMVWVEGGRGLVDGVTQNIPARFGAAFISGLRGNLLPQIGLTNRTVSTYSSAPRMYGRYRKSDLDDLAKWGVQILVQEDRGAPVKIRHQCTTDTSNDILNFEETTTVRVDAFSFHVDAVLENDIGQVNTTEAYAAKARAKVLEVAQADRLVPVGVDYGPLIDDFANLSVTLDPQFLDRVNTSIDAGFGPPTNRHAITVNAYGRLPAIASA